MNSRNMPRISSQTATFTLEKLAIQNAVCIKFSFTQPGKKSLITACIILAVEKRQLKVGVMIAFEPAVVFSHLHLSINFFIFNIFFISVVSMMR